MNGIEDIGGCRFRCRDKAVAFKFRQYCLREKMSPHDAVGMAIEEYMVKHDPLYVPVAGVVYDHKEERKRWRKCQTGNT